MGGEEMFKRIQAWDDRLLMALARRHTPFLNKIMIMITTTGNNGYVWFALAVPFLLMNRWRLTGFTIMASLGIATLTGEVTIKHIVKRVRPCNKSYDQYLLIENPPHYSFPSGHTTASFAVSTVIGFMCPTWLTAVLLYAILLSFSRLYLLVHYPSDVIAGVFIGIICGAASVPISAYIPFFSFQF